MSIDRLRARRRVLSLLLLSPLIGGCESATEPSGPPSSQHVAFPPPSFTATEPDWQPADRCDTSFADVVGCDVRPAAPEECQKPCLHPVVKPDCVDGWCRIPHGCFIAGAPYCQLHRAVYTEEPTQMTLSHDFAVRQTELTQAEWVAFGFPNPSGDGKGGVSDCIADNCPVGNVSWFDMLAYANRLSELHGFKPCFQLKGCSGAPGNGIQCKAVTIDAPSIYECDGYRPPTAIEWEYAVRGGTATSFFTGSMVKDGCYPDEGLIAAVWYCANSELQTRPVRGRAPNPWGLYDMLGNAAEWNMDALQSYPKGPLVDHFAENDPFYGQEDDGIELRAFRGGAVHSSPDMFAAARRIESPWEARGPTLGFRLAKTLKTPK